MVVLASAAGFARFSLHSSGSSRAICTMNGAGFVVVTVTVRAASSALATAVTGTERPSIGDWFLGSAMWLYSAATSSAVSAEPSSQVTPGRMVNVAEVVVADHFSATPGTGEPSASRCTRVSYAKEFIASAVLASAVVGLRLPGSPATATVTAEPSPPPADVPPPHAVAVQTRPSAVTTTVAALVPRALLFLVSVPAVPAMVHLRGSGSPPPSEGTVGSAVPAPSGRDAQKKAPPTVRRTEDGREDTVIADGGVAAAGNPMAAKIRNLRMSGA